MIKKTVIGVLGFLIFCLVFYKNGNFFKDKFLICNKSITIAEGRIFENGKNDIEIKYPIFKGLYGNQDENINDLVKEDIYRLIEEEKSTIYEAYDLCLFLDYNIKCLNDNLISICYSGIWWPLNDAGRGAANRLYTLNIDVAQAKVINKRDIFVDANQIYNLLEDNKFEGITTIEGIRGGELFSDKISMIGLEDGLDSPHITYYIDGDNLVIVLSGSYQYYEYSIDINEVSNFLNEYIVQKIISGAGFPNHPDDLFTTQK